jgi:uncharacterized protein YndB with AHSA1/START domain
MKDIASLTITTPSDREIAITRVFDAPRRLVWEAYTKPELLKRWLGAFGGWSLAVCEMDLKVGGAYRWVWRKDNGIEMAVGGVYREIVPPERIVHTESFDESWYPGEAQVTTVLVEHGGKTTLTLTILYESRAARDVAFKSDMEKGVAKSYDKLAELLESLEA